MKWMKYIFLFVLVVLTSCMKPPVEPEGIPALELELDFTKADENLTKTQAVVELPVFDLQYSGNIENLFTDGSDFYHETNSYNIELGPRADQASPVPAAFAGNSWIQVFDSYYRMAGNQGVNFTISFNMLDVTALNQVLVEKMDGLGHGYRVGLENRVPYIQVIINDTTSYTLRAANQLSVNTWRTIQAGFRPNDIRSLTITGMPDTAITIRETFTGYSDYPLMIGNSFFTQGVGFNGFIDELVVRAGLEFEEFDLVRVAVMDANFMVRDDSLKNMTSQELYSYFNSFQSYLDSTGWYQVTDDLYHMEYDTSEQRSALDWGAYREVWDKHFSIISEQNLLVKDGFAQGVVNGVSGLDVVAVGAMRDEKLIYYGYGFAWAYTDRQATVYVVMSGG